MFSRPCQGVFQNSNAPAPLNFVEGKSTLTGTERNIFFTVLLPPPTLQSSPGLHTGFYIDFIWFSGFLNHPTPVHHTVIPVKHTWDQPYPYSKKRKMSVAVKRSTGVPDMQSYLQFGSDLSYQLCLTYASNPAELDY